MIKEAITVREAAGRVTDLKVLTERVKSLREDYLSAKPQICAERSRLLTEYWKQSEGVPIAIRRASAFRNILEGIAVVIRDGELLVGSQTRYVRGCSVYPETATGWVVDDLQKARVFSSGDAIEGDISAEDRKAILEDCAYWKDKSLWERTRAICRERWGDRVDDAVECGVWAETLSRQHGRCSVDYARVLSKGLNGIIQEAQDKLNHHQIINTQDLHKQYFWEAAIIACQGLIGFAHRYARLARELAIKESSPGRKRELEEIAAACEWVPANPPRNFREAVQTLWFTHLALQIENNASGYSPGRADQYLYSFYRSDVEDGRLTREQAAELLACLWIKFTEVECLRDFRTRQAAQGNMYQNMTIGGQTSDGRDATNELSYLILEVTRQVKLIQPTISLRYHDGLPDEFLIQAAEVNRDYGGGMPAWFNDKAALVSLTRLGIPLAEARNWAPIGCVERGLSGSSPLTMSYGFLSVAKCLELALYDGRDPKTGKQLGPHTGNPGSFATFEQMYGAFRDQLDYAIQTQVLAFNVGYSMHSDLLQVPYNSALMNDCIDKGKDITEGGGRWLGLVASAPHGMQNTANALVAIKKRVFEDKTMSMGELLGALEADFEGKESLHQSLLTAPKYGNDDDYADEMMDRILNLTVDLAGQHTNPWGEQVVAVWNGITVHYYFGKYLGALPDGRKAGEPTADGSLSAFRGTDTKGPTAVIRSASKIDSLRGLSTLLNLKFHPAALQGRDGLRKLLALVKTYFDLYGHHLQFNLLDRSTLLEAKKHPEKYRDLIVRVAGFSAFFVELAPEVQDEIIARTEHSF
ncbi:MAG: glycyl radical protein [Chloroflexi bacterium]|nr:glycyl radical protein [Chloroflexota bacterium]